MRLIRVVVDELPASCWVCSLKYSDDYDYLCPLILGNYYHEAITEYKTSRHPDCILEAAQKKPTKLDNERVLDARDDCGCRQSSWNARRL